MPEAAPRPRLPTTSSGSPAPLPLPEPRSRLARLPFFYGWAMIPIAMIAQACTCPGQTYGIAIFHPEIRESLLLSPEQITFAYLLGTLAASAPLSLVGTFMDRHGIRKTMFLVTIALGLACIGTAHVRGFWTLFLAFFFLRFLGQGALTLLANNILAMWFHRRLGLVSGIKSQSGSLSLALLPPALVVAVESLGWRGALIATGLAIWAILLPIVIFLFHDRPEDIGQLPDGRPPSPADPGPADEMPVVEGVPLSRAIRGGSFWILLGLSTVWGLVATAVFFHMISIHESSGLEVQQATWAFSVFAVSMSLFQLVGGWLADRCRPGPLIALSTLAMTLGVACLVPLSPLTSLGYAILFGSAQGLLNTVINTVWPRFYGRAHLGQIRGAVWTATVVGSSAGPFLLSLMARLSSGNFDSGLLSLAALFLPFTALAFFIRPPRCRDGAEAY